MSWVCLLSCGFYYYGKIFIAYLQLLEPQYPWFICFIPALIFMPITHYTAIEVQYGYGYGCIFSFNLAWILNSGLEISNSFNSIWLPMLFRENSVYQRSSQSRKWSIAEMRWIVLIKANPYRSFRFKMALNRLNH